MLKEDKIIEVGIYPQNRKHYQERLGRELDNWITVKVKQRDVPPSARIGVHFTCDACGIEYIAERRTQGEPHHNTYCSDMCQREGKRVQIEEYNPNPKVPRVDVECWNCKKAFEVVPSVYKKQNAFCCSWECYQERRRKKGFHLLNDETDIERIVREYLEEEGVEFETQKSVYPYWCDFYLPEQNLILEVFGDYWHANPKKYGYGDIEHKYKKVWMDDAKRANYIIDKGYRFAVLWEDTIKNEPNKAKRFIKEYLNNN